MEQRLTENKMTTDLLYYQVLIMKELNKVKNKVKDIMYSEESTENKYWKIINAINTLQPEIAQKIKDAENNRNQKIDNRPLV